MTIKVEINPIPNSNKNKVTSYNENKDITNNKLKRTLNKTYIVPKENTDEFVTKIKKSEKNRIITVGLSALAGAGTALGFGLKNPKIDYTVLGIITLAAGVLTGSIPSYIINIKEKNLFKKLNVNEIKE